MRTVLSLSALVVLQPVLGLQREFGVTVGHFAAAVPPGRNRTQSLKVLSTPNSRFSPTLQIFSLDFSGVAMKRTSAGQLQSPVDTVDAISTDPWRLIDKQKHPSSWYWLAWTLIALLALQWFLLRHLPDTPVCHVTAFLLWLSLGAVFGCYVYYTYGLEDGDYWIAGYLLELGFGFENVMVFNMILGLLDTPAQQTKRVVLYILGLQMLFEFVFFLGLADLIRHFVLLPYMLAAWFVYCGVLVLQGDHDDAHGGGHKIITTFSTLCGDRFFPFFDDVSPERLYVVHKDKIRFTLMVPLIGLCVIADFVLEIDVVLAKIDLIPDGYIAFSSSALAGFAMTSLIFIMRDITVRYPQMKYSISIVFIYFGINVVAKEFIAIPPLLSCSIVLLILGGFLMALLFLELLGLIGENDEEPECTTRPARRLTNDVASASQDWWLTQVSRRSWSRSSEPESNVPQESKACTSS